MTWLTRAWLYRLSPVQIKSLFYKQFGDWSFFFPPHSVKSAQTVHFHSSRVVSHAHTLAATTAFHKNKQHSFVLIKLCNNIDFMCVSVRVGLLKLSIVPNNHKSRPLKIMSAVHGHTKWINNLSYKLVCGFVSTRAFSLAYFSLMNLIV